MTIHPTAIVDPRARVHRTASIGAYAMIGAEVELGEGVRVHSHAVIEGPTTLGARVEVHPFAAIGGAPQDRTYAGERTSLSIGEGTILREHVTIHRGTTKDRGETRVGARCLVMVGVHVAHDAIVGDDCTIANASQIAGHCVLEDHVVLGGAVALAPFVRVGESAFVAAGARVEHDVPPFHIAQGDRARVRGLNLVGLKRREVSEASIAALETAHRVLYRSGTPLSIALATIDEGEPLVGRLVAFLRTRTTISATR